MEKEFLFSNFEVCPITHMGLLFPTLEHAFQASKFFSLEDRKRIQSCETPGQAKRLARQMRDKIKEDWLEIRVSIMRNLLKQKFSIEKFRKRLNLTHGEIIEFNTWHDNFWGVCQCNECRFQTGHNMLGKLLMEIRDKDIG